MNGFKCDFLKIFLGGDHRAPDLCPRFFSGFALGLDFALNSQALRALDSGFASILGRVALSIRASPLTFDWGPWFGPPE